MGEQKTIVSVGDFEGPLDLLLSLVQKNKINIYDVSIAAITDQYLSVIRSWQAMDMDVASDFIVMASRLLEIKSYKLLPKPKRQHDDDPEAALVQQLADYKLFKAAGVALEKRFLAHAGAVYRDPMSIDIGGSKSEVHVDSTVLADSYQKIMRRYQADNAFRDKPETDAPKPAYTTKEQREKICQLLAQSHHQPIYFSNVIFDYKSSEVIASFLAMLDLAKENCVTLEQRAAFEDIRVSEVHGTTNQNDA